MDGEDRVDRDDAAKSNAMMVQALNEANAINSELLEVVKAFSRSVVNIDKRLARIEDLGLEWKMRMEAMDASPLWKFICDKGGVCRDIFERHIVTKLSGNDRKFLYSTNTESREAMRRANIELRNTFYIHEMSSRSTLQLAWEHYAWGEKGKHADGTEYTKDQEQFSYRVAYRVAYTNKLDLLQWLREEKKCSWWDEHMSNIAAKRGNLAMLKYCVENGCKVDQWTCVDAVISGNLTCLKYLREKNCPWTSSTVYCARKYNRIDCLNYALEQKCPEPTAAEAAKYASPLFAPLFALLS